MTITLDLKDDTILSEPVEDQPALHGLLFQVRDLDYCVERLLKIVKDSRANSVVFYHKKYCDPHAWDYPPLAVALDGAEIPHLLLEVEQVAPVGQTRVRVEAFVEMISDAV